jgi:hypothetical protein
VNFNTDVIAIQEQRLAMVNSRSCFNEYVLKRLESESQYLLFLYVKKKSKHGKKMSASLQKMQKINEEALSSWAPANQSQENKTQYLYKKQLALVSQYHHLEATVLFRSIEIRTLTIQNECLQLKTRQTDEELEKIKENEVKIQGLLDQVAAQSKQMEALDCEIYGPSLQ